ncbi:MAG: peptide chain release factor N(5)-glutamine methyltransferase [Coriobacteriia bacterium]|nr:peptide chain release factor N(5)-glutamine methyltransferase [Coriobacteriia bacterium]
MKHAACDEFAFERGISCAEVLRQAEKILDMQGEENPASAASFLVSGLLGLSPSDLVLRANEAPAEAELTVLGEALQRRALGEPLQYIVGKAPFRFLELAVRSGVLIPRPETELLVDFVLEHLEANDVHPARVLDIGTGSGAIALALVSENAAVEVVATDMSEQALLVAQENAACLPKPLQSRISIIHDDLATSFVANAKQQGSFDIVVSNPPYIPSAAYQKLPIEIANYEPQEALEGGADGLDVFRRLAKQAACLLKPGGLLACELDETNVEAAARLLKQEELAQDPTTQTKTTQESVWQNVACHVDLAGRLRFVTAQLSGSKNVSEDKPPCPQRYPHRYSYWGENFSAVLDALQAGKPAIFPTDTVYGIGVAVNKNVSLDALYQFKERDEKKPIAWLVSDVAALLRYADAPPAYAAQLAEAFWPGALTLIVRASTEVPPEFQAKDGTIALRLPNHTNTLELIRQLGVPLATSSANLSDQAPATSVQELDPTFAAAGIPILDGGTTQGSTPSTVVSCLGAEPVVVRQGLLSKDAIKAVVS